MECLCSAPRRHVSGPANAGKLNNLVDVSGPANAGKLNNLVDLNNKNVYVLLVVCLAYYRRGTCW